MGTDPMAFYGCAFLASFLFVAKSYFALPLVFFAYLLSRMLSKKDPDFMYVLLKYLEERDAYSSIPRPSDWKNRPEGWGKGLPW